MMTSEPSEKKIIVDEDWKSRVEAEKEAARRAEAESNVPPGEPSAAAPANLSFLVGTLYIQGAMALGLMVNPVSNKVEVHLDQAKHAIDLLDMLQRKTEGNRTPEESEELEALLHELRLAYVAHSSRSA